MLREVIEVCDELLFLVIKVEDNEDLMILFFFLDFLINFLFRKFESVLVNLFVDCRLFDNGFINIDNVSVFGVFIFVDLFKNDVFFIFSLSS